MIPFVAPMVLCFFARGEQMEFIKIMQNVIRAYAIGIQKESGFAIDESPGSSGHTIFRVGILKALKYESLPCSRMKYVQRPLGSLRIYCKE